MAMLILHGVVVVVIFLVQSFSFSILLFDVLRRKKKDVCDKVKKKRTKKKRKTATAKATHRPEQD
jgi:hypothetical protein